MNGGVRVLALRPGEGRIVALLAGLFATVEAGRGLGEVAAAYDALCSRYGVQPPANFDEIIPVLAGLAGQAGVIDADAHPEAAARGAAMSLDEVVDFIMRDIVEPVLRPG